MASAVVHRTPGLINPIAFTVFGVNSKPVSANPIGIFGTGLKYAIAVLMRHGIRVTLFIGQEEYVFYTRATNFRDKHFDTIRMKKRHGLLSRWSYHDLPFTTELGKNWKLWQAFREIHANTLDENGSTYLENPDHLMLSSEETCFIISDPRYIDEFHDMDRNFLPQGKTVRSEGDGRVQVIDMPSNHVYYRGMRIMDLEKEAKFTYNFLETVELTEDRTAKYPWLLETRIGEYWMESEDEEKVKKAVKAPSSSFEGSMSYGYTTAPSRASSAFMKHAVDSPNPSVKAKHNGMLPTVPTSVRITIDLPVSHISKAEFEAIVALFNSMHNGCHFQCTQPGLVDDDDEVDVPF